MIQLPHLLSQLGSENRLSILETLNQRSLSVLELSDELLVSTSDVVSGLSLLLEAKMIETTDSGEYTDTEFGVMVLENLAPLRFIAMNRDYLQNHDLSVIPLNLQKDMDRMAKSNIISARSEEFIDVKRYWINVIGDFSIITEAISPELAALMTRMISNGVKVRCIIPKDSNIDLLREVHDMAQVGMETRILPSGKMLLHVAPEFALLGLRKQNGGTDPEHILVSTEKEPVSWCRDLFAFHWSRSRPFR